jgi:hypothetical protein
VSNINVRKALWIWLNALKRAVFMSLSFVSSKLTMEMPPVKAQPDELVFSPQEM